MNNLSARLRVNAWMMATGQEPLPASLSYTDFATKVRKRFAPKQTQVPFASRSDAVAYVRHVASSISAVIPPSSDLREAV